MRNWRALSASSTRVGTAVAALPSFGSGDWRKRIFNAVILFGAAMILFQGRVIGAPPPAAPPTQDTVGIPSVPARSWAVDCAANEVLVIEHTGSYLRYRMHVVDEKGDQLRDQIETPDGSVARLIERDGRPITPDEDAAERERLTYLMNSPGVFARHIKNETANKKLGVDLLKLMPDAMMWSYAPGQPPLPSEPGRGPQDPDRKPDHGPGHGDQVSGSPSLVVLDFKPNPKWSPPTIPAESLTGLEGRVWVDSRTRRMVRLEGDLFQPVNVGWGMVGHLYPGGKVMLEQMNANAQRWIVEHIDMQLSVRVLMVKTVKVHTRYDTPPASFQTISPMTYQQAIRMLLDTPLPSR